MPAAPSKSGEPSRASRLILVGIVAVLVLALDLWTKAWAWENLRNQPAVEVIEGLFYLKFGFNTGAAFSFLRDASWARRFFIIVTIVALVYMGWLAWKMPTKRLYGFFAVGLIGAGATGNLHDRIFRIDKVWVDGEYVDRHGVVDFLQFYYPWNPDKYWPIFNVADTALVCGVALLLLFLHFHGAEAEQAAAESEESEDADEVEAGAEDDEAEDEDEDEEAEDEDDDALPVAEPVPTA